MKWLHYECVSETKTSCEEAVIWNCPTCRQLNDNILHMNKLLGLLGKELVEQFIKLKTEVSLEYSSIQ